MYISIYIPKSNEVKNPATYVLNGITRILDMKDGAQVQTQKPGDTMMDANDLVFNGRIFIYDENETEPSVLEQIASQAKENGHDVRFRTKHYAKERSK